ncbi:hypothetical protein [Paenibacillus lactis]|uniref:hypothetical protein n=1 Tax=Paenibacillus lactis TaxID=228574 RepID=UPI003D74DC88
MRIDVERQIDNLSKHQFIFWYDESRNSLWVDEYNLLVKETPRHKYRAHKQYKRIASRSDLNNLTTDEVPLNEEIREAAISSLVTNLKVGFWEHRDR